MSHHTIHWLGAGLSSGPGIVRVARAGKKLVLWNRTVEKAKAVFSDGAIPETTTIRAFDLGAFQSALHSGDVVVSMLPATMHPEIAEICLSKKAHLVTTSYISDAMRNYHQAAKEAGLCFVNESGLDPGIDHVLAHLLVQEYRKNGPVNPGVELHFKSYCGGFPKVANEFKYKFSWSPAGVLRALTNRAKYIENGKMTTADRAWEVVKPFEILGESFEVYPNRDSLPYLSEYGFRDNWNVGTFVRGTIRLGGWSQAWASIFEQIPGASNERIEAMGADLWSKHAYGKTEEDRVVLYVSLDCQKDGKSIWHKAYCLDDSGTGRDTAMGRLVSWPATFAIDAIENGKTAPGVSGAPHDPEATAAWMQSLAQLGVQIKHLDLLKK